MAGKTHFLDATIAHYEWDNAIAPRLEIDPTDTVVFETRDSSDQFFSPRSTHEDVGRFVFRGHPLTGPVFVRGARPGHVLVVHVIEIAPRAPFGWTYLRPGRGLLPPNEFTAPFLQIWDVSDGHFARGMKNVAIPLAPFPGVMGVALPDAGRHSTVPPRRNGGNMDVKQLTAGSTLFLPVFVDGALFSVGDAHGAQGDGEVCITAVEMNARITLRFDLLTDVRSLFEPQLRTAGPPVSPIPGPHYATTAHGEDLHECARQAVRHMIDHLVHDHGLSREEAYVLCSVAVDLKISEIVDAPNWIVSAFLPERIFGGS